MKKNRYDILDHEHWTKNHPSPMAKWLHNFSLLGACWFGQKGAIIWFLFFNQAMMLLYFTIIITFTLMFYFK